MAVLFWRWSQVSRRRSADAGADGAIGSLRSSVRWRADRRRACPRTALGSWPRWLAHELSPRYRQSPQPAADRSVWRLVRRRRQTAPAAGWAARHCLHMQGPSPRIHPRWGALRVRNKASFRPGQASIVAPQNRSRPSPAGGAQNPCAPALTEPAALYLQVTAWPEKYRRHSPRPAPASRTGGAPAGRGVAPWLHCSQGQTRVAGCVAPRAAPLLAHTHAALSRWRRRAPPGRPCAAGRAGGVGRRLRQPGEQPEPGQVPRRLPRCQSGNRR